LGEARATVEHAIAKLGTLPSTKLTAQSSLFSSAPIDSSGDDYVNAVAQIETSLDAHALLAALRQIEQDHGRERPYRNAPRTLDLDILIYGTQQIHDDTLTVPHPRMTQRAFVLLPLLQIDPFIAIPGQGPAHQFVPQVADQAIRKLA
jgi:2-amino-4-hydroxy-6-hydroxymethyldihydropteridine diphosphokinase